MESIFWFIAVMDLVAICLVLYIRWRMQGDPGVPSLLYSNIPPMPKCKAPKLCQFISGKLIAKEDIDPGDMIIMSIEDFDLFKDSLYFTRGL